MQAVSWRVVAVAVLACLVTGLRADPPPDPPDAPASNGGSAVGEQPGTEPIEAPGPGTPPAKPEDILPPEPAGERKKAEIIPLEPGTSLRMFGPEHKVVARGKVQMVIPSDEVILYCNAIDYDGEVTGEATLTGDLRVETGALEVVDGIYRIRQPENVLTGEFAYVFTKEMRLAVDRNVVLVHRPLEPLAPDADELEQARHDVTTVYCDLLNYWYRKGDRKAVLQPRLPNNRIRFEQPTRRGTAGRAKFYDFEEGQSETGDVLDLEGNVFAEDDEGQLFEAEVCRLLVDLDEAHMHNVRRLVINLEEEPPTEPGGEVPPMPGTETPGPTPGEAPAEPPSEPPAEPPAGRREGT